ncbi:unnamed protein product, partial [Meganyctiphanes norvegica]
MPMVSLTEPTKLLMTNFLYLSFLICLIRYGQKMHGLSMAYSYIRTIGNKRHLGMGYSFKIIDGFEITPYQLALYLNHSEEVRFHCGGALVSPYHVITAAHCVSGWHADRFIVVGGAHDLNNPDELQVTIEVQDIKVQEFFDWEGHTAIPVNDIAILQLSTAMPLSDAVQIVSLPDQDEDAAPGTQCIVSGWGSTQSHGNMSSVLMGVTLPVMAQEYCTGSYDLGTIHPEMMCAGFPTGGYDSCTGDSGGPLVCDGLLQGVVSWGPRECGKPLEFGVYTRVAFYRDWIEKHNPDTRSS